MWEIHNNLQIYGFLYSLVLGMIFAIFYDVFRAVRIVKIHSTIGVFLEDILFFLVISNITFIFLLSVTNGEIRGYILFGILLGFVFFYKLISRFFIKPLKIFLGWFSKGFSALNRGFYWLFAKIDGIISLISKNTLKILKKVLKTGKGLLYTNKK